MHRFATSRPHEFLYSEQGKSKTMDNIKPPDKLLRKSVSLIQQLYTQDALRSEAKNTDELDCGLSQVRLSPGN